MNKTMNEFKRKLVSSSFTPKINKTSLNMAKINYERYGLDNKCLLDRLSHRDSLHSPRINSKSPINLSMQLQE